MPIRADHVSFAYEPDRPVVGDLTFALAPGTVTALLGPNGAGKSTLLRLLLGLLAPTSGRVTLDGHPLDDFSRRVLASRVVYVPQRSDLAFSYTAEAVVAMGRYVQERATNVAAVRRALDRVEMGERARDAYGTLSAGQQQRVTLARALAQLDTVTRAGPRVLLADEPVAAMDPKHAMHAMGVLRELAGEDVGVLVVLHDLTLASRFCDHALLLGEGGRQIGSGPASVVLNRETLRAAFQVDFLALPDPVAGSASNLWVPMPDMM